MGNLNIPGEETIDMCKAWADQKEYGRTIGFNQGEIARTILLLKEFNISNQDIILRLIKDFNLSKKEAEDKVLNFQA